MNGGRHTRYSAKEREEVAKSVEKTVRLGSKDADRTEIPGGPTNREAIHRRLADVAGPRERGLQAGGLYCIQGRAADVVVRVRKIVHSPTPLALDQSLGRPGLMLHLRSLRSGEERVGCRMGPRPAA